MKSKIIDFYGKCRQGAFFLVVIGLLAGTISCNDALEDSLRYDYSGIHNQTTTTSHVLLVVVDGLSGKAVQQARLDNRVKCLEEMQNHALYSDYGLADGNTTASMTNARGWANLLLGTTAHSISTDEDLLDNSHDETNGYPSLMKRLEGSTTISLYASTATFHDAFSTPAMRQSTLEQNDAGVVSRIQRELEDAGQTPSQWIVAELSGVNKAGSSSGYYTTGGDATEAVVDAVEEVDRHIASIMSSLKKRPYYKQENWLVIIAGSFGGTTLDADTEFATYYDDPARNVFTLFYNERQTSTVQGRPGNSEVSYIYETLNWSCDALSKSNNRSAYVQDKSLGFLVFGEPMTYQFFFKAIGTGSGNPKDLYYPIISKLYMNGTDRNGWALRFNGKKIRMMSAGIGYNWVDSEDVVDGKWHSLTLTFAPDKNPSNYIIILYIDGKKTMTKTLGRGWASAYFPMWKEGWENADFRIGGLADTKTQERFFGKLSNNGNFQISNLQIYNCTLPEDFIAQNAGKNRLDEIVGYEYWDNLIAYWPCDRPEDAMLTDSKGNYILKDYKNPDDESHNFIIDQGKTEWTTGTEKGSGLTPLPSADPDFYCNTLNSVDVCRQICLWLGRTIDYQWGFEGRAWAMITIPDEENE